MKEFLYEKYHPENAPYCSEFSKIQFNKIKENNFMTVTQLHQLTEKWIKLGYGDKKVIQAYDCNFAYTGIGGKVKITDTTIEFLESDYPDRSEE